MDLSRPVKKTIKQSQAQILKKDFRLNFEVYLMVLPILAFYIIFHYVPMYGVVIAFQDFVPTKGFFGSQWVGLSHLKDFVSSYYFWRILKNTVWISFSSLVVGFPAPIIFALLINELKNKVFTKSIQTVTYMPHFISIVVLCGMIKIFTSDSGFIGSFVNYFTGLKGNLLGQADKFVPIYVLSGIWQEIGWGSIIYLAALAGIDQELYEAAVLDGAGRWKQTLHITLPGIAPTIIVLLILRMGSMLNVGFEKIILLYSPAVYDTSDVISSFVYRKGLIESNWSYSAAVGLFNSIVNFILLIAANNISRKVNDTSLW